MERIVRVHRRTRAAMVVAFVLLLSLSSVTLAFASGKAKIIHSISSDPYTNSSSQHKTQVEPDTYSFGSTIISTFQSGRFLDGGSSNIGWATSTDGGKSWQHGFLPGTTVYATPPGTYARISDPAVSYDAKHNTWIIFSLALDTNTIGVAVLVSQSTDGGLTWNNPVVVKTAQGNDFFDKTWGVCDNTSSSKFYGHCYAEWDNFGIGELIQISTSTNGGNSWGTPKATGDNFDGTGAQPVVQPNGTVIVPLEDPFTSSIYAFTSTNGGKSWSSTSLVTSISDHGVGGGMRARPFISAEVDASGKVYVVWQDCRFENGCAADDLVMTTTTDGKSWSAVVRIPSDPLGSNVDHFIPGLAVDRNTMGSTAHLAVTFYYFPDVNCSNNCQLDVGIVSSTDGGNTWTTTTQIAGPMNPAWLANTNQGFMVGDYISTSIVSGKAFPAFANAKKNKGTKFKEAMYTLTNGFSVVDGSNVAGGIVVAGGHPASFGASPTI